MTINVSVRVGEDLLTFLKRMEKNINKVSDKEEIVKLSYAELLDIIVRYNKFNSLSYTEMINWGAKNV